MPTGAGRLARGACNIWARGGLCPDFNMEGMGQVCVLSAPPSLARSRRSRARARREKPRRSREARAGRSIGSRSWMDGAFIWSIKGRGWQRRGVNDSIDRSIDSAATTAAAVSSFVAFVSKGLPARRPRFSSRHGPAHCSSAVRRPHACCGDKTGPIKSMSALRS